MEFLVNTLLFFLTRVLLCNTEIYHTSPKKKNNKKNKTRFLPDYVPDNNTVFRISYYFRKTRVVTTIAFSDEKVI